MVSRASSQYRAACLSGWALGARGLSCQQSVQSCTSLWLGTWSPRSQLPSASSELHISLTGHLEPMVSAASSQFSAADLSDWALGARQFRAARLSGWALGAHQIRAARLSGWALGAHGLSCQQSVQSCTSLWLGTWSPWSQLPAVSSELHVSLAGHLELMVSAASSQYRAAHLSG
ncbi:hypothetical protein NDU88_011080 [Pleurodeles waltl]|uniref:Uncharacterized protein n=1 Tax=Pleurodeles waltl TaxID=8319 RepID=A0AAV7S578_PLEWA|nr:hypothetical protein NDU88_011080 [Pleurodeles waltl]